jgi:hypothetical protein
MKKTIFHLLAIIFAVVMLSIISISIVRNRSVRVRCEDCDSSTGINPYGKLTFEFSRDIDLARLESLCIANPQVDGSWELINERSARWTTANAMPANRELSVSIQPGVIGTGGEEISKPFAWNMQVRPARILISQSVEGSGNEIYALDFENGSGLEQLTFTDGNVYDYAPAPDGEAVAFSAINDENGIDLWIINRDGSDMHKILDCASERCLSPVWSPEAGKIAYSKESSVSLSDKGMQTSLWILDTVSSQSTLITEENQETAFSPVWSPDGVWLSFWRETEPGIQIINIESGEEISLESTQGGTGCWSADSCSFYFSDMTFIQAAFHHVIRQVDFGENTIKTIIGDNDSVWLNYGDPECHPIDNLVALSIQPNLKVPGQFISLIDLDSLERTMVLEDYTLIPSNLSWDASGDKLLFQMNRFNENDEKNLIYIWDRETQHSQIILENAFSPAWLP